MAKTPEIGSEFSLSPDAPRGGWIDPLPSDTTLVRSGRDALRALLTTLRSRGRTRLIAGAFLCDALVQAAEGWTLDFVPVDDRGLPRPAELMEAARTTGERGVLLAVPLFGAPWPEALVQVAGIAKAFGVEVVEDRTHSLFSGGEPLAPIGFASLRKWFALPDGGACWGLPIATPTAADDTLVDLRADAMRRKHRFLTEGRGRKTEFLTRIGAAEEHLDGVDDVAAMSMTSRRLLTAPPDLLYARRRNYERLFHTLPTWLRPVSPALGPETCPLGLAVATHHRDALKAHLIRRRIYPAWHWKRPDAVEPDRFPGAAGLADSILTLVCDQRYSLDDMDRTSAALKGFRP